MNLIIDIGNTKVKAAVYELDTLVSSYSFEHSDFEVNIKKIISEHSIKDTIISSVKVNSPEMTKFLSEIPNVLSLNHQTEVPFINTYSTPTTLGIDRIALVAGAVSKFPNKNCLVIDAGTCITYDFVNEHSEYLGGAISPGIDIRYRSLNDYTAKLPRLSLSDEFNLIGKSTSESIHSGVVNGVIQEIEGVINQYKAKYPDLTVILTGGDTKSLFKQLKNSIFAHQNFLLYGLNQILTFNNRE